MLITPDNGTALKGSTGNAGIDVGRLGDSTALVVYGSGTKVYARIVHVASDRTITLGTEYEIGSLSSGYSARSVAVVPLSAASAVAAYVAHNSSSGYSSVYCVALAVSGDTITAGTPFTDTSDALGDAVPLSSTQLAVSITYSGGAEVWLLSVSGTTLTLDRQIVLLSPVYLISPSLLGGGRAVVGSIAAAGVGAVSPGVAGDIAVPAGLAALIAGGSSEPNRGSAAIAGGTLAVAGVGAGGAKAVIVKVEESGAFTVGALASVGGSANVGVCAVNGNGVLVYGSRASDYYGIIDYGRVSGVSVTFGGATVFRNASTQLYSMSVRSLAGSSFIVAWHDNSTGYHKVQAGNVSPPPTAPTGLECDGGTNPEDVEEQEPLLTALFHTSSDPIVNATHAKVKVATNSEFSQVLFETGWIPLASPVANGQRSEAIPYARDPEIVFEEGKRYWWRIAFRDEWGSEGVYSSETACFTMKLNAAVGLALTAFSKDSLTLECTPKGESGYTYFWVRRNGAQWPIKAELSEAEYTFDELAEATEYEVGVYITTAYAESERAALALFTGREMIVTEVRDHDNVLLPGAAVVALSETELLALAHSDHGEPLPALGIAHANKAGADGKCTILVPGNKGKALVLFTPPSDEVGGDVKVHIET
jgi:hypothetical protein